MIEFIAGSAVMFVGVVVGVAASHVIRHGLPTIPRPTPRTTAPARAAIPESALPDPAGPPPPAEPRLSKRFADLPEFDREMVRAQVFEDYMQQHMDENGRVLDTEWLGT